MSGDATGTVTYEWGPGEKFLLQHVDITLNDHHVVGLEVIGRLLPFGAEEPSEEIMSRFYGSDGETYDYVYEVSEDGKTLMIWGGVRDSPPTSRARSTRPALRTRAPGSTRAAATHRT